jgi:glycosyltransferase involved in cell wall biosynthesis
MTGEMVDSLDRLDRLAALVDTRDPRPLSTIGRLDLTNVALAVRHTFLLWRALARSPGAAVYLPISQETWGFVRDAAFVLVARIMRRSLIVHLHGGRLQGFYRDSSRFMRRAIRLVLRQATEAWALTPSLMSEFAGLVPSSRVRCVGNVVRDPLDGQPGPPERRQGGIRVLYLANLLPEKGCFDLIAALQRLGLAAAGWEVRMVGGGERPVAERLRRDLAALPAGGAAVEMTGQLTGAQKDAQYRWADVFAYPTYYPFEGQPLVVLEAMAAGLPVLSTRHGGIPETVRDGVEGILVEPRDVAALGDALALLAADGEARARLAAAARRRYEENFSPARLTADLVASPSVSVAA